MVKLIFISSNIKTNKHCVVLESCSEEKIQKSVNQSCLFAAKNERDSKHPTGSIFFLCVKNKGMWKGLLLNALVSQQKCVMANFLAGIWMLFGWTRGHPDRSFILWTSFAKHLLPPNVIFPVKMPPILEVWSWSLGGYGFILTAVRMSRTPVFMVQTTFAKHLLPPNVIFPVKMPPVLEVWSWSLGGQGFILTAVRMSRTPVFMVQTTFAKHLLPPNVIFPVRMPPVLEVWSWSLGKQGVILRVVGWFLTPNIMVLTTFPKHLLLQNVIFPVKMTPVHEVLLEVMICFLRDSNFEGSFSNLFLAGTQSLGHFIICFVLVISPLVWPFLSSTAP